MVISFLFFLKYWHVNKGRLFGSLLSLYIYVCVCVHMVYFYTEV